MRGLRRVTMARSRWIFLLGLGALGCGGIAVGPLDGGPDGANDASSDAGRDDAGYTDCSSPSGYAVCGGSHACKRQEGSCTCASPAAETLPEPTVCFGDWGPVPGPCIRCKDGEVCGAVLTGDLLSCLPFEIGVLYLRNGASPSRIRYFDRGLFTGVPIPNPDVCPTIPGVIVCGGTCGGCSTGQYCMGRSPLHPVGFCYDPTPLDECAVGTKKCGDGRSCFTFKVEPEGQVVADANGLCVVPALCQALAQSLPGGGTCTPP